MSYFNPTHLLFKLSRADIHQAILREFYVLVDLLIGKIEKSKG